MYTLTTLHYKSFKRQSPKRYTKTCQQIVDLLKHFKNKQERPILDLTVLV